MLKNLGRFLRLPAAEKSLLLQAIAAVTAARLAVGLLPARRIRALLTRAVRVGGTGNGTRPSSEAICWAVSVASSKLSGATCLARALAAQWLLAASGHPSSLRLGVARDSSGDLMAHAWLERDGLAFFGHAGREAYAAIFPAEAARR